MTVLHRRSLTAGVVFIGCALALSSLGYAQTPSQRAAFPTFNAQNALSSLAKGTIDPGTMQQLGDHHVAAALGPLEKQFKAATHTIEKAQIAEVLVMLNDTDQTYWHYLESTVQNFLNQQAPSLFVNDEDGKPVQGIPPAFEQWVDANKLTPSEAFADQTIVFPACVLYLGHTGDRRAIPILRKALSSNNDLVVARASEGLVGLKDEESIPAIIEAASKASPEVAALIAEPLGYMKSASAQQAFAHYVSADTAQNVREAVRQGKESPLQNN